MDEIFEITAKEVTIQVKDERTGTVYSRTTTILEIPAWRKLLITRWAMEMDPI